MCVFTHWVLPITQLFPLKTTTVGEYTYRDHVTLKSDAGKSPTRIEVP